MRNRIEINYKGLSFYLVFEEVKFAPVENVDSSRITYIDCLGIYIKKDEIGYPTGEDGELVGHIPFLNPKFPVHISSVERMIEDYLDQQGKNDADVEISDKEVKEATAQIGEIFGND